MKGKHIDDVQTQTVDEHFKLIQEDKSVIDPEASDVTSNDLPDWYDEKLFKEGQNFYKQNMMSVLSSVTVGLIATFAVESLLKIFSYTQLSKSSCSAFNRYNETLFHIHNLFTCDANDTNSKWYKSINVIRWYHKMTTKRSKKANIGEISQRDMVLTQYGFVAFVFIAPESFGLCPTLEENEAFNHFWRVTGYMLGISDNFNLCRKNPKETTELCQKIKDLYAAYLSDTSSNFHNIASQALDALWYVDVTFNKDSFMAMTYELHGLTYKKIGWYSWFVTKYRQCIFYLCLVSYIRVPIKAYTNFLVWFILWSSQNFPLRAWMIFGKNNVRLNLYPKH